MPTPGGRGPDGEALYEDIARPRRAVRAGLAQMAGFRARSDRPVDLEVVPHPAVTLVFSVGDTPPVMETGDGRTLTGSIVAGLLDGPARATVTGADLVQVRLSPAVAPAVLGVPLGALPPVPLYELWGRSADELEERVRESSSWQRRFDVIGEALVARVSAARQPAPEVVHAWHTIIDHRGSVRVEDLAQQTGWSRQRLWSRFAAELGTTPKRAARLARFDHAARLLAAGSAPADVAHAVGYADQSHLHRDARSFAGTTPARVGSGRWLSVDRLAWPDGPLT